MKQTPRYQLCQWENMDRILMEDFNEDNRKIDTALAEVSTSAAEQEAQKGPRAEARGPLFANLLVLKFN
jgi:hypothetical protein